MPTRIELLKQAGFSDAEIGDWATAERQRMNEQGFTDDEIDEDFGVTRPPEEVPEAFIERLKQGNAASRIAGAAGDYAQRYFGDAPLGFSPNEEALRKLGVVGDIVIPAAVTAIVLPRAEDFRNAAAAITGTPSSFRTEQRLLQLYKERGLTPAEVAQEAMRDPALAAALASESDEQFAEGGSIPWGSWAPATGGYPQLAQAEQAPPQPASALAPPTDFDAPPLPGSPPGWPGPRPKENPAQSFTLPEVSLLERYKFSDAPDIIKRQNPGYHIVARGQAQGGRYSDMMPAEREAYQRQFAGAASTGFSFVNPLLGAGISVSGALASGDPEGAAGEALSAAVPYGLARYPKLGLAALTGWLTGSPTEAEATPLSRLFRGVDAESRAVYNEYIRRHFRKADDFAKKYFSGMHDDRMMMSDGPLSGQGPYLNFDGPLTRQGEKIGDITRTFYPDERFADHGILNLLEQHQGQGIAKRLLADQFDVYQKMNFGRVDLFAGLDSGAYTWAKFGFLPLTRKTWKELAGAIGEKLQGVQGLDPAVRRDVEGWLKSRDPRTLWRISDLDDPIGPAGTKLGKVLLLPQSWKGRFDLENAEQMRRFNKYVGR